MYAIRSYYDSTTFISPGAIVEMSTSTGAPAALARSEGHMLVTNGTAAPTEARNNFV